jgi:putative ABC transport system substrate-binding protein
MDRRTFLGTLSGGFLAAPLAVEAQQVLGSKLVKVGFLLGGTSSSPAIYIERFKQTLRERGWVDGQNVTFESRYAEGHYERLTTLAHELVSRGLDVIVTEGTPPARAAKEATTTVPIVMASTADPVGTGLVSSLAHPGGNLTGVSWFFSEITAKRFELLREAAPRIARVGVVYNPLNPISEPAVVGIEALAKTHTIRIQRLAIRSPADFDSIFPAMTRQSVDAVTVLEDPLTHSVSLRIVDVALKNNVPAVFGLSSFIVAGGLMSYGPSRPELWRKAALLTDKILRGAKPGDLPIEQPTEFELVINLKTAKVLGLTIPPSLLQRADQVIE